MTSRERHVGEGEDRGREWKKKSRKIFCGGEQWIVAQEKERK
jgi:hypothetical protein